MFIKDPDQNIMRLRQAVRADKTAIAPRVRLANHFMRRGTPEEVEPVFSTLNGLQRRSLQVLQLTALAQMALREYPGALAALRLWTEEEPENAQAHYLLGLTANTTGDSALRTQALRQAVTIDPDHILALIALAQVAQFEHEREQFDRHLGKLVELAPEMPEVLRLRALTAQSDGHSDNAVALSQRVFKLTPSTQSALELASLHKAAGNDTKALSVNRSPGR